MGPLSEARRTAPLPVLVLTGFLGAGKTSLLNHVLAGREGRKVAALVNDFGEIEVDAAQVAGRVDSIVSLASGCLCCEVDVDELTETLVDLADPELGLDLAIIEASGLAEPDVLRRMIHAAPRDLVDHAGLVQVLDADNLTATLERHPRLSAHIAEADLVVLNKCDLVSAERFADLRGLIRDAAPRVAVYPAVRGAVPVPFLLGESMTAPPATASSRGRGDGRVHSGAGAPAPGPSAAAGQGGAGSTSSEFSGASGYSAAVECECTGRHSCSAEHEHLHEGYESVSVRPGALVHPRRLLAALSSPPPGLYRAKGRLTLGSADGPVAFDIGLVGRRLEFRPAPPGRSTPVEEGLVLIGVDLGPGVAAFLDDVVLAPGEVVDDLALLGLHPYLVEDDEVSDIDEWIYDEQRRLPRVSDHAGLADPEDPEAFDPAFTP